MYPAFGAFAETFHLFSNTTQSSFTKQRTVLEHRIQTCSLTSDPCLHSQVAHSQYPVSSKRSKKGLKKVIMLQQFFPRYTGHTCFLLHSRSYVYLSLSLPMYFNSGVNRHVLLEKHMIYLTSYGLD